MNNSPRQKRLAGFEESAAEGTDPQRPAAAADTKASATGQPAASAPGPAPDLRGKTVYVLDAHSLIYQVFHALPEMTGPAGQPVGAIHGFLRDVVDILDRRKPDYLFCAFDLPGETFRHQIYDGYKASRPSMPLDLRLQIPNIQRFLQAMRIPILSVAGYEADDVLATVARLTDRLEGECLLVTSDKDCRQLITDRVRLYNIRKDQLIGSPDVVEEWGIRADQVIDFQALWGDATDDVPGVPGIGKKTAAQLLSAYESLEGIYEHLDELKGKKRENLASGREAAFMSRQLVRLADDVPVELDWREAHVGGIDLESVQDLCAEFGFQRLTQRLTGLSVTAAPATWTADYRTIGTLEELAELVAQLSEQSRIAVDTETTSTRPRWAEIVGLSFSWQPGEAVYLPVRAPAGDPQLDADTVLSALRPVLEDPDIAKIGQNLKYDMIVLRGAGVDLQGVWFDTMVADYLLSPGERSHGIDDLAKRYLNHETIKIRDLIGTGKHQKRMDQVPVELVTPYAAEDADVPLRLASILDERLKEAELGDLFTALEIPLIEILAEMEFHGMTIDVARLEKLSRQYGARLAELESEIHALAGRSFNIDSPKQLAQILFQELNLRVVKKTKTGPSTDASVLSQLADEHPLPAKIIEYRQHAKLKSTYVDALPALVHPQTGRVHTSFKQDVAATGRLSSTDPNLQNIPVRTKDGREIRAAFVAGPPGWNLLCADYSQIELRVLAHCSGDEALLAAFREDRDIHAQVASEVYGVSLEEVTRDMRRSAKAINFGVIYGQSAFGLAKALHIDKEDAAAFIDAYFARYPGVDQFMTDVLTNCRKAGYVSTILGRRRAVTGVRDPGLREDPRQRNLPERIAINTVIQGSAADLIKQAMIGVHRRLRHDRLAARMLLQIHDELLFEVPSAELETLASLVQDEMTTVGDLRVPLKVDLKVGANWADCESYGP